MTGKTHPRQSAIRTQLRRTSMSIGRANPRTSRRMAATASDARPTAGGGDAQMHHDKVCLIMRVRQCLGYYSLNRGHKIAATRFEKASCVCVCAKQWMMLKTWSQSSSANCNIRLYSELLSPGTVPECATPFAEPAGMRPTGKRRPIGPPPCAADASPFITS